MFSFKTYLDCFLVLFVVKSDVARVEFQKMSELIRDIGSHLVVATVLEPDLQKSLLVAQ